MRCILVDKSTADDLREFFDLNDIQFETVTESEIPEVVRRAVVLGEMEMAGDIECLRVDLTREELIDVVRWIYAFNDHAQVVNEGEAENEEYEDDDEYFDALEAALEPSDEPAAGIPRGDMAASTYKAALIVFESLAGIRHAVIGREAENELCMTKNDADNWNVYFCADGRHINETTHQTIYDAVINLARRIARSEAERADILGRIFGTAADLYAAEQRGK